MIKTKKYDYSCLMLKAKFNNWDNFCKNFIKSGDVYTEENFGIEKEPHITILYGFEPSSVSFNDIESIYPSEIKKINYKIIGISLFQNENYDVVKFDIESNDLRKLNLIYSSLPHQNNYKDYQPHLTIFYCKKGQGEKYIKKIKTIETSSNKFLFSTPTEKYFFDI